MKTFAEQVADLKATREAKNEELRTVAQKSVDEGRSMDSAEAEQFDTLSSEIKQLDGDIARLSRLIDTDKATAKPVEKSGSEAARTGSTLQIKHTEKLEKGIGFARFARVQALASQLKQSALDVAMNAYPNDSTLHEIFAKAGVSAANTGSATWASNLILDGGAYFADFVELLRERSVLGQIGGRLRSLPFDTQVLIQSTGGNAYWTAEGAAKPLTSWTYTRTKLAPLKVAAIAAATQEQLMRSTPAADALIRDELVKAVGAKIDSTFIGTAGASTGTPAGILNGVSQTPVSGTGGGSAGTVEAINCDIGDLMKAVVSANNTIAGAFWIIPETVAIDLSLATNAFGAPAFPGITPTGGTLKGLPVFTSQMLPHGSADATVILMRGDDIFLADEGGVQVSISDQASLLMTDDANSNMESTTPTGSATLVSMWQTNSVAFRVERYINWARRQAGAIAWAEVDWNGCS